MSFRAANSKGLAVITGASRGIGRATAECFIEAGWDVLCLARSHCTVEGAHGRLTDLLKPGFDGLEDWLVTAIPEEPTKLCLIHNAAMHVSDSAFDIDPEILRQTMELMVIVPAALNKLFRTRMGEGSSILYVGSTLSEKAVPGCASYVTSKHALAGLMRATCQDAASYGQIHTALVCPGFTATEMLLDHIGGDEEALAKTESMQIFGRLIEPREIGKLLLFCAENPVINGAILHGNLGQVER